MREPWTVARLRKALAEYDQEALVLLASDAEGNEYHLLDALQDDTDGETIEEPAVVLWPRHA